MAGRRVPGPFWEVRHQLPRDKKETLRQMKTLESRRPQPRLRFELCSHGLWAGHPIPTGRAGLASTGQETPPLPGYMPGASH